MGVRRRGFRVSLALTVAAACTVLGGCTDTGDDDRADRRPVTSPAPAPAPTPAPLDGASLTAGIDDALGSGTGLYERVRVALVTQSGRPLVELAYGPTFQDTSNLMSVTKSVTSTLVGIAQSDGLLDLDATLAELLPTYTDHMSTLVSATTLEQMLTMTAGLPGDPEDGLPFESSDDWVGDILDRGITEEPGTFVYSSAGSHLLAAILTEATGTTVLDFARERLFDPLGIDTRPAPRIELRPENEDRYAAAGFVWPVDPQGIHRGHAGLKLAAADLVRFGQLYLDDGRWRGDQVVPEQWLREATTSHLAMPDTSGLGYGYQWWTTTLEDLEAFVALGFGGQVVEVIPDLALVAVVTSDVREPYLDSATLTGIVNDTIALQLE